MLRGFIFATAWGLMGVALGAAPASSQAVPAQLEQNRAAVLRAIAAVATVDQVRPIQKQVDEVRSAARENLAKLAKDQTLKTAHVHYDKLLVLVRKLNDAYARRAALVELLSQRQELLRGQAADEKAEATLTAAAEKALDQPLADASAGDLPRDREQIDPARQPLRFYRFCRQVDAYNREQEKLLLDWHEAQNARQINLYRELLGLMPLEIDARLVQSARRHSKEMIDLKYFSHVSPTESLATPFGRIAGAGFVGWSWAENIATQIYDGDKLFFQFFDSPDHHENFIRPELTSIGVGRWDWAWTENFGGTKRLMLATAGQRAAAGIKGELLKPWAAATSRPLVVHSTTVYRFP